MTIQYENKKSSAHPALFLFLLILVVGGLGVGAVEIAKNAGPVIEQALSSLTNPYR